MNLLVIRYRLEILHLLISFAVQKCTVIFIEEENVIFRNETTNRLFFVNLRNAAYYVIYCYIFLCLVFEQFFFFYTVFLASHVFYLKILHIFSVNLLSFVLKFLISWIIIVIINFSVYNFSYCWCIIIDNNMTDITMFYFIRSLPV